MNAINFVHERVTGSNWLEIDAYNRYCDGCQIQMAIRHRRWRPRYEIDVYAEMHTPECRASTATFCTCR